MIDAQELATEAEAWRSERWPSMVPPRYRSVTLTAVEDAVAGTVGDDLHGWLDAFVEGRAGNLLMLGGVGVGKTFAALALARELWVRRSVGFLFRPVVELLDDLRPGVVPAYTDLTTVDPLTSAIRTDLLILDDLGGEKPTDWTSERLYLIVNRRWLDQRPTVVTTNLEPADFVEAVGQRTYDRLKDGAVAVRLGGESKRVPA